MESIAIGLAIIGGVVAAPLFCLGLVRLVKPFQILTSFALWPSFAILLLFALELGLVSFFGAVGARKIVGPAFFLMHSAATLLLAPALACSLLLGRRSLASLWPFVAIICWIVGVFAIFYQYDIAESLYGIDFIGGPYVSPF